MREKDFSDSSEWYQSDLVGVAQKTDWGGAGATSFFFLEAPDIIMKKEMPKKITKIVAHFKHLHFIDLFLNIYILNVMLSLCGLC